MNFEKIIAFKHMDELIQNGAKNIVFNNSTKIFLLFAELV